MNHLEGWDESINSRITPEYIEFVKREEKKYEKSKPSYSINPSLSYQIERAKGTIRSYHQRKYKALRRMFPDAIIHHQWVAKTAEYEGVALVEGEPHKHNKIKTIKILEGRITKFEHEL